MVGLLMHLCSCSLGDTVSWRMILKMLWPCYCTLMILETKKLHIVSGDTKQNTGWIPPVIRVNNHVYLLLFHSASHWNKKKETSKLVVLTLNLQYISVLKFSDQYSLNNSLFGFSRFFRFEKRFRHAFLGAYKISVD